MAELGSCGERTWCFNQNLVLQSISVLFYLCSQQGDISTPPLHSVRPPPPQSHTHTHTHREINQSILLVSYTSTSTNTTLTSSQDYEQTGAYGDRTGRFVVGEVVGDSWWQNWGVVGEVDGDSGWQSWVLWVRW